jgi:hypothetical protein
MCGTILNHKHEYVRVRVTMDLITFLYKGSLINCLEKITYSFTNKLNIDETNPGYFNPLSEVETLMLVAPTG